MLINQIRGIKQWTNLTYQFDTGIIAALSGSYITDLLLTENIIYI